MKRQDDFTTGLESVERVGAAFTDVVFTGLKDLPDEEHIRIDGTAIVLQADGVRTFGRCAFTENSLIIPDDASEEEWAEIGFMLGTIQGRMNWYLGDWYAYGEDKRWTGELKLMAERFGYEMSTAYSYASICRRIPPLIRVKGPTFSHHRLVTSLPDEEKIYWLEQTRANGWTVEEMKRAIKNAMVGSALLPGQELFDNVEKIDTNWHKLWIKAMDGSARSRNRLLKKITAHRRWLEQIEATLLNE